MLGERVYVDLVVPRTSVAAKMRLLSSSEDTAAELATLFGLRELGFDDKTPMHIWDRVWRREYNARVMSIAVRDPNDVSKPLDAIEQWRECDEDQINALNVKYNDLGNKIDPLGSTVELTQTEHDALASAAKKKLADTLLSYGSRKLALFAISLVDQPAT